MPANAAVCQADCVICVIQSTQNSVRWTLGRFRADPEFRFVRPMVTGRSKTEVVFTLVYLWSSPPLVTGRSHPLKWGSWTSYSSFSSFLPAKTPGKRDRNKWNMYLHLYCAPMPCSWEVTSLILHLHLKN